MPKFSFIGICLLCISSQGKLVEYRGTSELSYIYKKIKVEKTTKFQVRARGQVAKSCGSVQIKSQVISHSVSPNQQTLVSIELEGASGCYDNSAAERTKYDNIVDLQLPSSESLVHLFIDDRIHLRIIEQGVEH